MTRSPLALLLLCGCFDFKQDLVTCRELGRCAPAADECALPAFPPPATACGSDRDIHLSATGDDANPGTAQAPRKTVEGLALLPGDRIHLAAGTWDGGLYFGGDGQPACPITVDGAPDHGSVFNVRDDVLRFAGSHWRVSDLSVVVTTSTGIHLASSAGPDTTDVTVQNVKVLATDLLQSMILIERCRGCSVIASRFEAGAAGICTHSVQAWSSPGLVVRGNSFAVRTLEAAVLGLPDTTDALVEGNTFDGTKGAIFRGPGGRFIRNVVHDVDDDRIVDGAALVSHNTFVRLGNTTVARGGVFTNNVVSIAGTGYEGPAPSDGGYNVFNAVNAYTSGGLGPTDVNALPKLDADFLPMAGSPLIDAADPASAVAPGGGSRADIGAREVGAVLRSDGRYCFPADGGN